MSTATSRTPKREALLGREELGAWRGFLKVHSALVKELDAELTSEHGLSLSAYEVLLFLADAPDSRMRMSDLADSILLSRSGLTRLVDRLEREGLVRRLPCPSDARGFNAELTEPGRTAFDAARRTHLAGVRARFLDRFSAEEMRLLATLWERFETDEIPSC